MSVLQRRLTTVAGATADTIDRLWQRHIDGDITEQRFIDAAAVVIASGNQRAVTLADLAAAATLVRSGRRAGPLGLLAPDSDVDRLRDSTRTLLATSIATAATAAALAESKAARLHRLARAEPLAAGQDATQRAYEGHNVERWVRQTGAKPCPLCTRWADGQPRPITVRMAHHTGCSCVPVPVT